MTLQSSRLAFIRGRHPRIRPGSCVRGLLGVKRVVEPPEGLVGPGLPMWTTVTLRTPVLSPANSVTLGNPSRLQLSHL